MYRSACVTRQLADVAYRARSGSRDGLLLAISVYCCFGLALFAQTSDLRTAEEPNHSWTATTDSKSNNLSPTRIIEGHSQNGNRMLDSRSVQIRGSDGHFESYQDIETETLQVDATTVRTTTRTFGRDINGGRALMQVTEEERHTLPDGHSNVVRVISNPDVNGRLKPIQREIIETKRNGLDAEETNTTVMLPSINGGLAPVLKTHELRSRDTDDAVESQKTTLLLDGSGNWQVTEIRQSTTRPEASNRSTEERVFRRDAQGKLSEVSRVVTKQSESTAGTNRNQVETYSVDVPGRTPDGSLHLVERATTVQRTSATGDQIIEKQVERCNPEDQDAGLRVSILINDTLHPGPSGAQVTQTIRVRDTNGNFAVVSVDTTKADRVPTIEIQQTSSGKPN